MTRHHPLISRHATVLSLAVGLLIVPALPAHAGTVSLPTAMNGATGLAAKINELKLTPGDLYYEDDRASTSTTTPTRSLFRRDATQAGGVVSVGPETPIATPVGSFLSASGDRYAYSNATNTVLTVKGPGVATRNVALSAATTTDVKLSGSRLLVSTTTGDVLTDLVTGAVRKLPASTNLFGRYAVWFNADGSVDRLDLTTGTTLRVRAAGNANPCSLTVPCTTTAAKTSAKAWGDWVVWRFDCETRAHNVRTGATLTLPCNKGTSLGNGLAVSKDIAVPANLLLQDLTTSPVSTSTLAANVKKFTLDDRLVAYADGNNAISVMSISASGATGSARLLTASTPPAFSPNGDGSGDTWDAELDVSKAVDSWSATITDATGTPVRHLTSTAPAGTGTIRAVWDGKDDTATPVADGVYTWNVTGTAADSDGPVVGDDGASHGLSGTVVVRRTPPGAKLTVPALSTTLSTTRYVPVSWSPTTPPLAGYAVTAYDVRVAPNRSATYATWLSRTTVRSARYLGTAGNTYRFQVRARDNAGNVGPWTVAAASILPFDDRSTSVKYAGTWTSVSASGTYLSTERLASIKGAKATFYAPMAALRVVTAKCATCGRFTVLVDGHAVATIDTYSATTRLRQLVYSRTISTTPGLHTVVLVVGGTPGRPRVYLDALGALR